MPNLAAPRRRAARSGSPTVIPPGLPPGSDVGNLAILGYDPAEYHTGRAPIEAAAMGVDLAPDEVAYRCNLVTIDDAGTMVDFAAGHVTSEQSHPIVAALDAVLGDGRDGVRFHPGVEYRHLCVVPATAATPSACHPHDLTGQPVGAPDRSRRAEAHRAHGRVDARSCAAAAAEVGSIATQIWLWGQGRAPALPDFADRFGVARPLVVGRRPRPRARRAHRHRGRRRARARPPASTTTTSRSVTRRWRRSPTATSSSCTSRPPTRPATRTRSTRRSRRSNAGTPTSSVRSSPRSATSRSACCSCPTTPRRARHGRTRRSRCRTCSTTRDEPGPGGEYSERGVAGATPVAAHDLMARLLALTRADACPGHAPGGTVDRRRRSILRPSAG